jgi:predicted 2-oxoglutarate/Fe(II)-dependent dioxygenase YbiX
MSTLQPYARTLRETGSVLIPSGIFFTAEEVRQLEELQAQLPEETVTDGDAGDKHSIHVRRILLDRAGEVPTVVNAPQSQQMLEILDAPTRQQAVSLLFGSAQRQYIRRCQMNRMTAGSFIGRHLDAASNPDYDYSLILQLGKNFAGGDFVVHGQDGERYAYQSSYGSVLITVCTLHHEVSEVTAGERNSLVYFYARNDGVNRRDQ